jgi:signal transduction histidine kinase
MYSNKLFSETRWRLASWYAGILSLILGISGLGVYEAIAHAHRITINQELETVAGTIHDSLEPILQHPGKIEESVTNLLPDLCLVATNCAKNNHHNRHLDGAIQQDNYYLQFFDLSGRLLAVAGIQPEGLSINYSQQQWQNLRDSNGIRYRQIYLELHTQDYQPWGYLQIGRNLQAFDNYVANVKWIILLGLPILIILVMIVSWWLAGKAMEPIYQSYQQIQQFTADAAHELRTPLAAIRATIESSLMLPTLTEKDSREILSTMKRQNQRLSSLVADLLMLSRMERKLSTNHQLLGKPVNINDLITDIAEEFAALAKREEISLIPKIEVTQPLKVMGDEEQLYRLVANLVINAIQHTLKGGQVTLVLRQENNKALIEVIDAGIGIPENEQKLIFDRFYRVNKARSRDRGGSGLGLAIAKAIALAHQGNIKVKSELGKGSTFTICFPIM